MKNNNNTDKLSTSSMMLSSLSMLARSWECSMMTCKALVIMFSVSSVLPDEFWSLLLRRGKQKEKAGADSGATSEKRDKKKDVFKLTDVSYLDCMQGLIS